MFLLSSERMLQRISSKASRARRLGWGLGAHPARNAPTNMARQKPISVPTSCAIAGESTVAVYVAMAGTAVGMARPPEASCLATRRIGVRSKTLMSDSVSRPRWGHHMSSYCIGYVRHSSRVSPCLIVLSMWSTMWQDMNSA